MHPVGSSPVKVELHVHHQALPSVYSDAARLPKHQVVGWYCIIVELYSLLHEPVHIQQVAENVAPV